MSKEAKTDMWVNGLLNQQEIHLEYQGSSIKELNEALKSASKKLNGNPGSPEFIGTIKDYLIVIEDKTDQDDHIHKVNGVIDIDDPKVVPDYAVNGALHYAEHLIRNTTYKNIINI